jgi:hypothetical protein
LQKNFYTRCPRLVRESIARIIAALTYEVEILDHEIDLSHLKSSHFQAEL